MLVFGQREEEVIDDTLKVTGVDVAFVVGVHRLECLKETRNGQRPQFSITCAASYGTRKFFFDSSFKNTLEQAVQDEYRVLKSCHAVSREKVRRPFASCMHTSGSQSLPLPPPYPPPHPLKLGVSTSRSSSTLQHTFPMSQ